MDRREIAAVVAAVVAVSLLLAPATMGDWGEQASLSVERVDEADVDSEMPILQFRSLSPRAQTAVERAIQSPDGRHVVYGREDFPDEFAYSDYVEPGYGWYVIVYEGQHYRLTTYAAGGFPFVYWLFELPFVLYGALLLWVASRTARGGHDPRVPLVAAVPGGLAHLLGPEFDFPLLDPDGFVLFGIVSLVGFCAYLARDRLPVSLGD